MAAWRWIFIIEGAVTSFLAIIAAFVIIDWPEQTRYLNAEEKELLRRGVEVRWVVGFELE
ncbi:hypothetical protein B0I37DRAFT_381720 [Chaetomium sp. MPI-CAGE-AT-0009]|nr:hypothetical protein B0I37DRAFT_381720 [Chaetomium sp. MPI-CAGE-AT-0009]